MADMWSEKQVVEEKRIEAEKATKLLELKARQDELQLEREKFDHQKAMDQERFQLEKDERKVQLETQRAILTLLLAQQNKGLLKN